MIYVCVPYTHNSQEIQNTRVDFARAYAARLFECGAVVLCPLVQRASIAHYMRRDITAADWKAYCRALMRFASEITIIKLDGWSQDNDVRDAIAFAQVLNVPVRWVDPSLPDKPPRALEFH